jgi:ADP-heptose:LPS heptosyltransferase
MADLAPSILLIRRRYLGDLVLLGSVLRNLRLHWPQARLTVLTEPNYAEILTLNPDIDATLTFPTGATGWPGFVGALRRARFTHVLDFDNSDKTALVSRLTGAALRTTYERELVPFHHRWAYTVTVPVRNAFYESHPITETCLALLAPLGVPIVTREVRIVPAAKDLAWAEKFAPAATAGGAGRRLLVHPGSRSTFRIWPPERFAAVCDRLQDELGVQVLLVGGPAEQPLVQSIRQHARTHVVTIDETLTIGRFAALAAKCGIFLCHDSGPMHVAAAAGARVVALYGSQNAVTWQPTGPGHVVLQTPLPCACIGDAAPTPCVKDDGYRSYCVRMLSVETVFAAVAGALAR